MDNELFERLTDLVDRVIDNHFEIDDCRSNLDACNMCGSYMKTYHLSDHRLDCPYVLALSIKKELDDYKNI